MSESPLEDLAEVEAAMIDVRLCSLVETLGPKLSRQHGSAIDHSALAEGLRMEAAVHATISGALAIRGVAPSRTSHGPGDAPVVSFQDFANNTTDGGYDLVDGWWHRVGGEWDPCLPGQRAAEQLPELVRIAGIQDQVLEFWWLRGQTTDSQNEIAEAGLAAQIYLNTERFGQAPPIRQLGRDGTYDRLRAPDIVNTVEHLEAQLYNLRPLLAHQSARLRETIALQEDILVASYDLLYANAPNTDTMLSRRYHIRDGEIMGGRRHILSWIEERSGA